MERRVLGVLNGRDLPPDLLSKWARSANILIAADGAYDWLRTVGSVPHTALGDFDSISDREAHTHVELIKIDDQNYTDCDKLIEFAAGRQLYPITLIGLEGDRLDHVFASILSVAKSAISPHVRLALRSGFAWVLGPGSHRRNVRANAFVSLIPLARSAGVITHGLKWALDDAVLAPLGMSSVSNIAVGDEIEITIGEGAVLLVVGVAPEEMPSW